MREIPVIQIPFMKGSIGGLFRKGFFVELDEGQKLFHVDKQTVPIINDEKDACLSLTCVYIPFMVIMIAKVEND